ncbi:zinc finger BED domain-containing protein RICESLEEPER 2-like [Nymphaea colorata]|uniref:zinc finger BED domain-containing protein RICESLEEPER 2-like n=1 Tax=Nymphaea colorata TaxID=210225 RepID=UPI00129ED4C0|nr:zinc finger BED domain-containing protein RICESLEEPER 2-like [Nymphaea colorata]
MNDVFVVTALIDMYSKCGCLDNAYQVSEKMPQRDVVAWNSMAGDVLPLAGADDEIMDSTTSGANASSSVSANNIEVDISTKTKSLRSAVWKEFSRTINESGERLASVIKDCLLKWNIDRKLFSITLDNCSTNDIMVTKLIEWLLEKDALVCNGKFFQVRCAAHILNLVVQDGVKEISDVIDKIRESIKYIKASPARCEIFDRAVRHVKVTCEKKLCLDVPTRWNSTFLMLDVALQYKEAFGRFEELDRHYHFRPTKDEWKKATIIHNSLKVFYDATNVISAVKCPTSNIFFKEFCEIKLEIEKMCSSSDI